MAQDKNIKKSDGLELKGLPDRDVDSYGNAICRWSNLHHQHIYIDGKEILYYVPPTGGWGNLYWEYPYGSGGDILKENRGKLRGLLQSSSCGAGAPGSFLARLYSGTESYVKSITKEALSRELSCLGKVEFKEMVFSPD